MSTQPAAPRSNPVPHASSDTLEPLYVKALPESTDLRSAIVSPDGKSIWALVQAPVVDVGWLINQHALTCASIIAAVFSLVLLAWLRRASRRRRTVGALHCRRCDYNVTGIAAAPGASALCPECGVELARRRPRQGLSKLRRLGLPVTLLVCVLAAYGWFAILGRKTFPTPLPQRQWGSATLQRWSSAQWLGWLQNASVPGELLLELDTQTGTTRRVIAARPCMTFFQMDYNPAAKAVYLAGQSERIDLVSVETGRTVASLIGHQAAIRGMRAPLVAGYDPTGTKVYLDCADINGASSWLTEWDWRTGAARKVVSAPGWKGQTYPSPAHHTMIPGDPVRFLRFTDFGEAFQTKHYRLTTLDAAGTVLKEEDLGQKVDDMAVPSFSRDGSLIFLSGKYGNGVLAFDSTTLEHVDTLATGRGAGSDRLTVRSDGRLMLIPGYRTIAVRDMRAKAWGPSLVYPDSVYGSRAFHFSADGRTVCTVFQSGGRGTVTPGAFTFKLGVWRLPESLAVDP